MKKYMLNTLCLVSAIALSLLLTSCQTTTSNLSTDIKSYTVNLYLKDYTPKFGAIKPEFKGKKMCLANIRNDARDTTNFSYYSKDNKVQYVLSNKVNTPVQLVPSFFWYAYQKAFEYAGIEAQPRCSEDMPELWIIFQSFNDEELQIKITLLENLEPLYEKNLVVSMPPAPDRDPIALQARAYEMIDLTITAILSDSGFQTAFE